jgi:hypothetical protein
MLTRTLATLTLFLALTGRAEPAPPLAAQPDRARAARHARVVDGTEGCREAAPAAVAAPAACTDEAQP